MSTSDVTICSNALLMLGDKTVASFSEDAARVTLASNLYPLVLLSVLRGHPWNCCGKRIVLAPDVSAPAFGLFPYQFSLPGDFIRVISVGEEGCEEDYRVELRKILGHTTALKLRYVSKVTDPNQWDALLVDVMVYAMAARMAYAITGSTSLASELRDAYRNVLSQAKAVDGQENPPETLGDFRHIRSRHGR